MKHAGEVMEILEAYDLVGTYSGAAALAGCDKNTVKLHVQRRDAGQPPGLSPTRSSIIDGHRAKIEELVDRSHGNIRADVVHRRLIALGFGGDERTTRRAVAVAKREHDRGRVRIYRPWIAEPGQWLQFDWGWGPMIGGRRTMLWCAWVAWSRFRVIIPTWDRTVATTLGCLDVALRQIGGVPTYVLTDNERSITTDRIAGVPVRHPQMVAAGRHYGCQVVSCEVADPETKGGSEATVKIAKADLVPTDANLRDAYESFAELSEAAEQFGVRVNARPHRATGRRPDEMIGQERVRLHRLPADPYVAALGETRSVTRECTISFGSTRYSVPHRLVGEQVLARVHGVELIIAHIGEGGVTEVARHQVSQPGVPRIDPGHYPPRSRSKVLHHVPEPRTPGEAAFLQIGPGAASWLVRACAAGTARIPTKMDVAVQLAAVHGDETVDAALAAAADADRFAEHDLASILNHQLTRPAGGEVIEIGEAHSLQASTAVWDEVGR